MYMMINIIKKIIACDEITPATKVVMIDLILEWCDGCSVLQWWQMKLYTKSAKDIQSRIRISKSQSHKIFFWIRNMVFQENHKIPKYHMRNKKEYQKYIDPNQLTLPNIN